MAIIKCKMCGGDLVIEQGNTVAECEYCGTMQTVPNVDDEKKVTLFARANRLRANNEFDKASGIYEAIVADFPEEAEAYWGLVLCKYGIEYVDDPATAKKIPTCHRSSFESVMDDNNFELTLEYADVVARKIYREEAKQIEEIRKGIIEVSSKEEPYDIFICYKETDENGDRTIDSVLAQDIYDVLTEKGYRTFFARITLEDKLGQEYEPYIFAALNSAKIMLAVGTDYEYYNAVWVKNEWSRFLKLMATDKSKHLIPCYKNIDAYDMPKEFAKLQAQDLGKVGAMQDLLRGIEKLLPKQKAEVIKEVIKETVVSSSASESTNVDTLLKRVFMFLEDGKLKAADEYCEKVLDIDPENAEAYLGKLMADLRVRKKEQLKDCSEPFEERSNCQKVMRYGDEKLTAFIKECNAFIIYNNAVSEMNTAETEAEFITVSELFDKIKGFRDSEELSKKCLEKAKLEAENKNKNNQYLSEIRKKISGFNKLISSENECSIGLKSDGTVVAVGDNYHEKCYVLGWTDIVALSKGYCYSLGLKSNGTVVAEGNDPLLGECNVSNWTDIVAIATGHSHSIGLKSDGTVIAVGYNKYTQCDVSKWADIIEISAGGNHSLGLKSNGTVVVAGTFSQRSVSEWSGIVAIASGRAHSLGLKSDGTVVALGNHPLFGECSVSNWKDIVAISAGESHSLGLKADGTVVAAGDNSRDQCDVSGWTDIVAISAGDKHSLGLKSDGTVLATGDNYRGQCNVGRWKLFDNYMNYEEERKAQIELRRFKANRRQQGACQHCGGAFKGLFTKKCSNCGIEKDY